MVCFSTRPFLSISRGGAKGNHDAAAAYWIDKSSQPERLFTMKERRERERERERERGGNLSSIGGALGPALCMYVCMHVCVLYVRVYILHLCKLCLYMYVYVFNTGLACIYVCMYTYIYISLAIQEAHIHTIHQGENPVKHWDESSSTEISNLEDCKEFSRKNWSFLCLFHGHMAVTWEPRQGSDKL